MTSRIKKSLTADTHSSTIFDLGDKPAVIIKNEPVSNPYTKDLFLIMTILCGSKLPEKIQCHCTRGPDFVGFCFWWCSVVQDSQNKQSQYHCTKFPYFVGWWRCTFLWNSQKKNLSVTEPSSHILFRSDSLQFQQKNRTHRPGQKLPPPVK